MNNEEIKDLIDDGFYEGYRTIYLPKIIHGNEDSIFNFKGNEIICRCYVSNKVEFCRTIDGIKFPHKKIKKMQFYFNNTLGKIINLESLIRNIGNIYRNDEQKELYEFIDQVGKNLKSKYISADYDYSKKFFDNEFGWR